MSTAKILSAVMMAIVGLVFSTQDLTSVPRNPAAVHTQESLKAQVLSMSPGSVIEVRLQDKRKLTGRLGEVTNEGFELQHVKKDTVQKETILFKNVKSVKEVNRGSRVWTWIGIGIVVFLVLIVVGAVVAYGS